MGSLCAPGHQACQQVKAGDNGGESSRRQGWNSRGREHKSHTEGWRIRCPVGRDLGLGSQLGLWQPQLWGNRGTEMGVRLASLPGVVVPSPWPTSQPVYTKLVGI